MEARDRDGHPLALGGASLGLAGLAPRRPGFAAPFATVFLVACELTTFAGGFH